jgi:hypothetical protein
VRSIMESRIPSSGVEPDHAEEERVGLTREQKKAVRRAWRAACRALPDALSRRALAALLEEQAGEEAGAETGENAPEERLAEIAAALREHVRPDAHAPGESLVFPAAGEV